MKNTPQQIFRASSNDLIGIPYEEKDCWQLTRHFYCLVFSINLSGYIYKDPMDTKEISGVVALHQSDFIKVSKPEFGDIILINILGLPAHVGVFLGNGLFLHTSQKNGSHIDRIAVWEKRIVGYYRYGKNQA